MTKCEKCLNDFEPTNWTRSMCHSCRCKITSDTTKLAMQNLSEEAKAKMKPTLFGSKPPWNKGTAKPPMKKICPSCGIEFETHNKTKTHCTSKCRLTNWHKNMSIEDKDKYYKKVSDGNKRRVEEGTHRCIHMFRKDTKPELMFEKILKDRNIEYIKQYQVKHKFYDFYLPNKNLLVEIHGDYWHSLENMKANDKCKKELALENGYKLSTIYASKLKA